MRRLLRWIIGLPVAVVVVAFAVANRQWTTISLDPFSRDNPMAAIDMPLWALFFVGLLVGLIVGWSACWLAQGKWRRALKETRSDLTRHQVQAAAQRQREIVPTGDAAL